MVNIIAAIKAIVELAALIKLGVEGLKVIFGDNPAKSIKEIAKTFGEVKLAETEKERKDAAKDLYKLFRKL